MRVFPKFPENNQCPVCGTNESKHTILVPIDDSKKNDSTNMEAVPTHLTCVLENIRYSSKHQLMGLEATKGHKA
tara:strand:- start:207 stop:428 length:222 start_codon:yes stop_codon:yes gene_type:complete